MIPAARVVSPSLLMPSGCWAVHAAPRRLTSSRNWIRRPERSSHGAHGVENSAGASPLRTSRGSSLPVPATAPNLSGATARSRRPAALERGGPLSGKVGAGLDPCAALQTSIELRPGAEAEIVFFLGQAENKEQARQLLGTLSRRGLGRNPGRGYGPMGRYARHRTDRHSRTGHGCSAESLAALPDAGVPRLGAGRILSIERCVRIPRPTPGRHGAVRRQSRNCSRAPAACCRAAVYRRRCSTLVASAFGTRCAHAHLGRPALAALRRHPLHRSHRRHDRARGSSTISGRRLHWRRDRTSPISSRACQRFARHCSSIAPVRWTAASQLAATASH